MSAVPPPLVHAASFHHLPRPTSRSSVRSTPAPYSLATDPPVRPSSAGSANRLAAQRGSFSPYDDDTPSSSPRSVHRANFADAAYAAPPPSSVARRTSGPRLPPLPLRSPIAIEHDTFRSRPSSVVSTASTTRKIRPPSIHMTAAPPSGQHAFLRHSSSSRPSRQFHHEDTSSDDDSHRSSLMPRSAVANYFNLDFSFLDEEPPPRPSMYGGARKAYQVARKERPPVSPSERYPASARSGDEDYFSMKAMAGQLPRGGKRDSVASNRSTQSLPFPAKLPFPSRPSPARRISSESVSSRKSAVYPSGERPYVPSQLSVPIDSSRRPSMASFMSVDSTGSAGSVPSVMYPARNSPPLAFGAVVETGPEAAEKRKRLAAFLNETASAMEGGKSLAMVLPESQPAVPQHKSLSELAEERTLSPRPSSRASNKAPVEYRHPFDQSSFRAPEADEGPSPTSGSQSTFDPALHSEAPSPTSTQPTPIVATTPAEEQRPTTVYFTPNPADPSPPAVAVEEQKKEDGHDEEEEEEDGPLSLGEALMLDRNPSAGLGLGGVEMRAAAPGVGARSLSERSPSTVRADSPASFAASQLAPVETEEDKRRRRAEKRMRTIRELVETETTYAVDMAVVRDIYLARARGAHMAQIADHVMSTGLGLDRLGSASPASPAIASVGTFERRASAMPTGERRVSSAPSLTFSSKLAERRPTVVPSLPNLMPGQPLMSSKDLHIVFANLEEIATLAEGFANLLDSASGSEDDPEAMDDRIGEVFVEMIPRIQQVYSTYCARHHRAILRLQELEESLRTYFSECKTLSHGRTNAWDLASLLIKPVQRCLKYPLLLDQILAMTPEEHPDRPLLQRANTDMLMVAEHINEVKKRTDAVSRIVNKEKNSQRRDSALSTMGNTVTKKLLRSSQKAKTALGFAENGGDEMFDTLVALVDSTRSGVLRFSNEMRDWTKSTKAALEAQVAMVEGWIDMYAPMAGEHNAASVSHQRLCIFLDEVLLPIIEGPWRELDHEVRRSLILKTDHLLSLFESPRQVIAKRNDKMLDHHRYLAKKLPADRRGSEDFLVLSAQLLEELPRFLGSVSRYFNIIVGHFAGAQAAYHEAVQERWNGFAEQWLEQVSDGSYDDIEASFAAQHQPLAQMMDTLAAGLGLAASQSSSPLSRKRNNRLSHMSTTSAMSSPAPSRLSMSHSHVAPLDDRRRSHRQSYMSATTDYSSDRQHRGSLGSTNRSSVTSDSSAPSLGRLSADGSSSTAGPVTPPPLAPQFYAVKGGGPERPRSVVVVHEPLGGYDRRSMALRYDAPLPNPPPRAPAQTHYLSDGSDRSSGSAREEPSAAYRGSLDVPRAREVPGRSANELRDKYLSTYSVYMPAEDGEDDGFGEGPLYIAEAMTASEADAFRAGYPILGFKIGDRLEVELEEADSSEGGAGWLLGRKVDGDGRLGWARTEHFVMIEDDAADVQEEQGEAA
ncbi:hypothetical protein JCM6882_001427 [Rhodosporidiobolus microsporus]